MTSLPKASAAAATTPAQGGLARRLRNVALFFAGPFITIGYLLMLPIELPAALARDREERARAGRKS